MKANFVQVVFFCKKEQQRFEVTSQKRDLDNWKNWLKCGKLKRSHDCTLKLTKLTPFSWNYFAVHSVWKSLKNSHFWVGVLKCFNLHLDKTDKKIADICETSNRFIALQNCLAPMQFRTYRQSQKESKGLSLTLCYSKMHKTLTTVGGFVSVARIWSLKRG